MEINRAITERRTLYIPTLDMPDAFDPISHAQLRNNLTNLGLPNKLTEVIIDSYHEAKVKIITLNGSTEEIRIARGVNLGVH
jgi:hypothetical protein